MDLRITHFLLNVQTVSSNPHKTSINLKRIRSFVAGLTWGTLHINEYSAWTATICGLFAQSNSTRTHNPVLHYETTDVHLTETFKGDKWFCQELYYIQQMQTESSFQRGNKWKHTAAEWETPLIKYLPRWKSSFTHWCTLQVRVCDLQHITSSDPLYLNAINSLQQCVEQ